MPFDDLSACTKNNPYDAIKADDESAAPTLEHIAERTPLYRRQNVIKRTEIVLCQTDFAEISVLDTSCADARGIPGSAQGR